MPIIPGAPQVNAVQLASTRGQRIPKPPALRMAKMPSVPRVPETPRTALGARYKSFRGQV